MRLLQLIEKTKKGKFGSAQTYRLYMPNGGEDGVLVGWRADWPERKWVEFRGPPYSQWEGKGSDFERVHDALEGRHATVLHTNDVLDVLPTHPRYDLIKNAIDNDALPPVSRGYAFESIRIGEPQKGLLYRWVEPRKAVSNMKTDSMYPGKWKHDIPGVGPVSGISLGYDPYRWNREDVTVEFVLNRSNLNAKKIIDIPGQEVYNYSNATMNKVGDAGFANDYERAALDPKAEPDEAFYVGIIRPLSSALEMIRVKSYASPGMKKAVKAYAEIHGIKVEWDITEAVVPFTKQWAPSDGQLSKIWQVVQALIKKGMGDELNGLFDNFKFAIEQYNDMAAERSIPSELAELSDRHLRQIFEYGKSVDWAPLSRAGFKARQRMIAQSWGKEVTEGITEAPVRNFKVGDLDTKHSTFGPTDRAMLQSPKARAVAKKRIKTAIPIDINVFAIPGGAPWQRDPATAYGEMPMQDYSDEAYSQVRFNQQLERWSGIMRQDDAEEIIDQPIQVNKDSVNVLYLSNANKISSVPLTPWMMMHRLGHSLEDAARKGHLGGNASEAYDDLYGFFTRRMGYMYGASLRQMMTTKAGRDDAINDGDVIPELIAQYLHNGRVRLVRPVSYEPTGDEDVAHKFELSNGKTILVKGDEIDDGDPMAAFTHKLEGDEKAIDEHIKEIVRYAIGLLVVAP